MLTLLSSCDIIHIYTKGCVAMSHKRPQIGDIFLMKFAGTGSEQQGWRPGLVFQNNVGNVHSPNIIALPLTSSLKKTEQLTHVVIPAKDSGLKLDSMVLCENPERMSKERIGKYITTIPDCYMSKIASASILATSAVCYLDPDTLLSLWQQARILNATATVA